MHTMEFGGKTIGYYDEGDIAKCRLCNVDPVYRRGNGNSGDYIRCPQCGVKTGTSTSGLEGLIPVWNAIMLDDWDELDPKRELDG